MPILPRAQMAALLAAALFFSNIAAAVPVIPGAAGFGVDTPAGRYGKVIRVTNVNDTGQGSLRACVTASGPRVCVFEVSGTIQLATNLVIKNPYLTIAGQTAPAPGIMLRGVSLVVSASDVLIQHIAVRAGDDPDGPPPNSRDSLKINSGARNVVIDHCSFSWALDENIETYMGWDNVTISNTIISEALNESLHYKGSHAYGALFHTTSATSKISLIGNLFAHNDARNPRSNAARFVFVNNVVYNPGSAAIMLFNADGISSDNSIVGNVFIDGVNTSDGAKPIRLNGAGVSGGNEMLPDSTLYLADNLSWLNTTDPLALVDNESTIDLRLLSVSTSLLWPTGLKALSTKGGAVLDHVLRNAGSRPGQRDRVDLRVISDVQKRTGQVINCVQKDGSAECSKNAGGWPSLAQNTHTLALPSNLDGDSDGNGYTNLEEWLHDLAADVEGRSSSQSDETAPPLPPTLQD